MNQDISAWDNWSKTIMEVQFPWTVDRSKNGCDPGQWEIIGISHVISRKISSFLEKAQWFLFFFSMLWIKWWGCHIKEKHRLRFLIMYLNGAQSFSPKSAHSHPMGVLPFNKSSLYSLEKNFKNLKMKWCQQFL